MHSGVCDPCRACSLSISPSVTSRHKDASTKPPAEGDGHEDLIYRCTSLCRYWVCIEDQAMLDGRDPALNRCRQQILGA